MAASLPAIAATAAADPAAALPLWKGLSCAIPFLYGGYVVLLPPAVTEMFGTQRVGVVFPKIFAMLNVASIVANISFARQRDAAVQSACEGLAAQVTDDAKFEAAFGVGREMLPALIANKTATIPQLMAIAPEGTVDPSPFLYNDALYVMSGASLAALGLHLAALSMGPYQGKYDEPAAK